MTSIAKTADAIQNAAATLAANIKDSSQVNLLIGQEIERKVESKVAALVLKIALEGELKDEMDAFPIIGSTEGNNPDLYEERVPTGKPGSFRKRKGSFVKDFSMDLPRVSGWVEQHKKVADALNDNSNPLAAKGKPWLEAEKKMLQGRVNTSVALVSRAIAVYQQEQAVLEYDGVEISYAVTKVDGAETISRVDRPIILAASEKDETGHKPYVYLSIGEFLALDPARGNELGGGFANLLASRKRESEAGSTKFNIKTAETFEDCLAAIANYFEDKAARDQLAKWIAHARKKNRPAIKTLGDVYITLGTIYEKVKGDYRAIADGEDTDESAAA